MSRYETLYSTTPNALGAQDAGVAACLARLPPPPLHILDFGAGQGRDALPLARAGYRVTAIDPAPSGLAQIDEAARAEALDIRTLPGSAEAADEGFDMLLSNRTLHMILDDEARHRALATLLGWLAPGGHVLLEDERKNIPGLRNVLERHGRWTWLETTPVRLFARHEGVR